MEMTPKLKAALRAYRASERASERDMTDHARSLMNEHDFSIRQTEDITRVGRRTLLEVSEKRARTGGKFDSRSLELLELAVRLGRDHELTPGLIKDAFDAGTSSVMIGRLVGESHQWVDRARRKAEADD